MGNFVCYYNGSAVPVLPCIEYYATVVQNVPHQHFWRLDISLQPPDRNHHHQPYPIPTTNHRREAELALPNPHQSPSRGGVGFAHPQRPRVMATGAHADILLETHFGKRLLVRRAGVADDSAALERRQKTEDRRQKTEEEDRRQKTEDRRQKTEWRGREQGREMKGWMGWMR